MCNASRIVSPSGALYSMQPITDPLGLTKTAIGDPAGVARRGHDDYAKKQAANARQVTQSGDYYLSGNTGESARYYRLNPNGQYTVLGNGG